MKPTTEQLLSIYRPVLARYEAEGDPMADVQRRLVAGLEKRKEDELREAARR